MEIAENNGGVEFRENNKGYNISATLGEAVVPNAQPIWNIRYSSGSNYFTIRINAISGLVE